MSAMEIALEEARAAQRRGEVPVGAVVLGPGGTLLARAGNRVEEKHAAAHAEMLALQAAAEKLATHRLEGCDLVVTLEPCPMCAAAISLYRIRRLIFGAYDPKAGGVEHGPRIFTSPATHHRPEVIGGIRERDCAALLKEFFAARRSAP